MSFKGVKISNAGFTLLELILVMVIISTLLAIASPSLRGFFASRKIHDAASNILSLTKLARSQAISEGRIYRLNLDSDDSSYWLTAVEKGAYKRLNNEMGRIFLLPDDTSFKFEKEYDDNIHEQYIDFYPEGRVQPGLIRLTDRRGDIVKIVSSSPLERYHLVTSEETSGNGC